MSSKLFAVICIKAPVLLLALRAYAGPADLVWSRNFGGPGPVDFIDYTRLAVDPQGNVIVASTFAGSTLNLGAPVFPGPALTSAGGSNIMLAKYTNSGLFLWAKRPGGAAAAASIATDREGNIYVLGNFVGTANFGGGDLTNSGAECEIFLAKFSPTGRHLWSKHFVNTDPSESQNGFAIATDSAGSVLIGGWFYGNLSVRSGGTVSTITNTSFFGGNFLFKFSGNGSLLWSKNINLGGQAFSNHLATDSSNNVYWTGSFYGNINLGGSTLQSSGSTDADLFVAKFSASGAHQWSKRFGDTQLQRLGAATADGSGAIYLSGIFHGSLAFGAPCSTISDPPGPTSYYPADIFVAKLDTAGTCLWARSYGSWDGAPDNEEIFGIATDSSENVVIAGAVNNDICFDSICGLWRERPTQDVLAVKFDSGGVARWAKRYGGDNMDVAWNVVTDARGNVFLAGEFADRINFGTTSATELVNVLEPFPTTGRVPLDAFVVKLLP